MKVKKICAKCGRNFEGSPQENYCTVCKLEIAMNKKLNPDDTTKQQEILSYVRDSQMNRDGTGVTAQEIMKNFGVSKEFINSMVRNELFGSGVKSGEKYLHPCEKCGTIIDSGVYCENCLKELRTMTKKAYEERELKKQILLEEELQRKNASAILIVDENRTVAEKIRRIIKENFSSYNILVATDLSQATNFIHDSKVKIVLIDDAITSHFNGLEILSKIREDYVISDIPVIMTTNNFDENKKSAAMNLDARDYIEKNLDDKIIVEKINEVLFSDIEFRSHLQKVLLIDDNEDDSEIERKFWKKIFIALFLLPTAELKAWIFCAVPKKLI